MAERLTPERLAKDAALKYAAKFGDDWDRECGYQDGFTAAYDAQQIEIDRLTSRLESLQALNRHHAAWRAKVMAEVDRNEERHVTTSNRLFDERNQARTEIDHLWALLGEALTALRHVETVMLLDCCRNAIAPVLAKLVQEGLS